MNTMHKSLMASRFGAALIALSALFGQIPANAETALERVQRTGEIRIGYANEAPFAYTLADGRVTGESPEIAKIVFAKMGIKKADAVLTEWGGLIPGLQARRFDVIAAGMYVTPARLEQVLFTDPHYPHMTALQNTAEAPVKALGLARREANERAGELLDMA
jgi:polar amino acid transport system substrate-binding protein